MSGLHDPNCRQILQRKAHSVTSWTRHLYWRCFYFHFYSNVSSFYRQLGHLHTWYAFGNILALDNLWWVSPVLWGRLHHSTVFASAHTYTHTITLKTTFKDKHRVVFTAQTGTRGHVWTQVCKWSRQSMRSDWLRLRTHTGGSGDRDRRVMMTSSRSVGSWFLIAVLGGALTDKGRDVRGSGVMTLPQGSCG